MKLSVLLSGALLCLAMPVCALADDASDAGDEDAGSSAPTLGCDGALCDTANGGECTVGAVGHAPSGAGLVVVLMALALVAYRARRLNPTLIALGVLAPGLARAEPPGPVDVAVHEAPPPRRYVSVSWNPISLVVVNKLSVDVVITPVSHHALVIAPFYAWTTTASLVDPSTNIQSPQQTFQGFGAELGYRYYFGEEGPRGLFLGGSFLLGFFTASPQVGPSTQFVNLGGALDVGYQMLVADRISLAAGAGVQYTTPDQSIPPQQFPANVYANGRFYPRLLLALGVAF